MRWKIAQFIFCEKRQSLSTISGDTPLEPLSAQVLSYFCRHPDQIISREELVETVWQNQAITDNAVNRVIAKLRKTLGDDIQAPVFIATFPKKGYRFIATIEPLEDSQAAFQTEVSPPCELVEKAGRKWQKPFWSALLFILFFSYAIWNWLMPEPVILATKVAFLTRGGSVELQPAVSPDGNYLLYSSMIDEQLQLYLKDLHSQETVKVSSGNGFSGGPAWSDDGRYVVYLYTEKKLCQLQRLTLNKLTVEEHKVLYNCRVGSFGKVAFSHDNNRVIYTESSEPDGPYSLFELNLLNATTRRLPQPVQHSGGNSQFDLHPTRNELLISSPDEQLWLSFYRLNLDNDQLNFLFKLNEYVCCPIWDHAGDHVVLMGEHPAYELIRYDLQGHDRKVIYQAAHRIDSPGRFPNGRDYVYVGGTFNRDIVAYSLADGSRRVLVNSSVDDRLASVSTEGTKLAYLSDRTGSDEIWLYDTQALTDRKLTSFNNHRRFFDLQWSPDGRTLAARYLNEIDLVNTENGQYRVLPMPQTEIRGMSWRDNTTLVFSVQTSGHWQVNDYDIHQDKLTPDSSSWAYIRYSVKSEDDLWFTQSGAVYYGPQQQPVHVKINNPLFEGRFNVLKRGNKLYYTGIEAGKSQVYQLDLDNRKSNPIVLPDSENMNELSIGDNVLYASQLSSNDADIFRTESR